MFVDRILRTTAIGAVLAAGLSVGALAQTSPPSSPSATTPQTATPKAPGSSSVLVVQHESEKTTAEVIGMPVFSRDGATVGKISHLLIDQDQKVTGAVLAVGGFLGIGSKSVAVPWESLTFEEKGGKQLAVVPMSNDELANAPEFKTLAQVKSERDAERIKEEQKTRDMSRPATPGGTGTAPRTPQ
jgi:sporulation protein YlmC with PRC-barrel domain